MGGCNTKGKGLRAGGQNSVDMLLTGFGWKGLLPQTDGDAFSCPRWCSGRGGRTATIHMASFVHAAMAEGGHRCFLLLFSSSYMSVCLSRGGKSPEANAEQLAWEVTHIYVYVGGMRRSMRGKRIEMDTYLSLLCFIFSSLSLSLSDSQARRFIWPETLDMCVRQSFPPDR